MLWSVSSQFVQKDLPGGLAWADSLPDQSKQQAYRNLYQEAFSQKKLPEVFAALGDYPLESQWQITGMIASSVIDSGFSNMERNAQFVDTLKLIPPHLRQAARDQIEKNQNGNAAKKQAALEALK